MTKLASVLGSKYESKRSSLFIRTFELGGHTFKVRIPSVAESDGIYEKIAAPDEAEIEDAYQKIVAPLMQFRNQKDLDSQFEFTDNDVLIDGRSLRETAKTKIQTQVRITEFIKLLVPENPEDSLADLTYADVELEFPMAVQMMLIEKIAESVSPNYKESRGN
jgi:hypothetical protein